MKTTRRDFIKKTAIASTCVCAGLAGLNGCSMMEGVSNTPVLPDNTWEIVGKELIVSINKIPDLIHSGKAGKISIADPENGETKKIIIVHNAEGEYKAFKDCCTHGCRELNYLHESAQLQCSSFGKSTFSLEGNVVKGPAKDALKQFSLERQGDSLVIKVS